MSTTKNTPAIENAELAQGLRDLADFLDQHAAELPRFASHIGAYLYGDRARTDMEAFASLRPGALESEEYGSVRITHRFGRAELYMTASVESVGGAKRVTTYRPILDQANGGGHAA